MRTFLILFVAFLLYMPVYHVANAHTEAPTTQEIESAQKQKEMLYPVVFVYRNKTSKSGVVTIVSSGNGVVIYSAPRGEQNEWYTYILTVDHILGDQSSVLLRWTQSEHLIPSDDFLEADVVATDKIQDLALLRVRDKTQGTSAIAHFLSDDEPIAVFDRIWAVGSGLGFPTFPTEGIISNTEVLDEPKRYIQFSAPIIYGNSGGGLFRWSGKHKRYEFVSIVRALMPLPNGIPITHMGLAIPTDVVKTFLVDQGFAFILEAQE